MLFVADQAQKFGRVMFFHLPEHELKYKIILSGHIQRVQVHPVIQHVQETRRVVVQHVLVNVVKQPLRQRCAYLTIHLFKYSLHLVVFHRLSNKNFNILIYISIFLLKVSVYTG
jgi:hypothetical protein